MSFGFLASLEITVRATSRVDYDDSNPYYKVEVKVELGDNAVGRALTISLIERRDSKPVTEDIPYVARITPMDSNPSLKRPFVEGVVATRISRFAGYVITFEKAKGKAD